MGHRQQMTSRQRTKWDIKNYKARLAANRGHNHSYMTDAIYEQLMRNGYEQHQFTKFNRETYNEGAAIEVRDALRKSGHYARIISSANRLHIREFAVWYKGRMILDPDADGKQWLYRGMTIMYFDHPKILPYSCYDNSGGPKLIDVASDKKEAMAIIDNYIKQTTCESKSN